MKHTGLPLASLPVPAGSLLGGVYAYLDNANRLVLVDGENELIRVAHNKNNVGIWQLSIAEFTPPRHRCAVRWRGNQRGPRLQWHGPVRHRRGHGRDR